MKNPSRILTLTLVLLGAAGAGPLRAADAPKLTAAQADFFEKKIRPILADSCYECHSKSSGKSRGGLFMDTREALLKGGDSGPGLVAGNPDKSLIIKAVRYTDKDLQMPPKNKKLSAAQIADLEAWIKMGAPDPRDGKQLAGPSMRELAQKHWAFRPVTKPATPTVKDKDWVRTPIDAFILTQLEAKGLAPSPPADKRTLLRRASYDLTGLPPTVGEYEAFLADSSPTAYEKVVDRLLKSPHYGERWGRYWLDLARYADSKGDVNQNREDRRYAYAWTYRDYVIKSFNEDKPYDIFVKEQLAADMLPAAQGPDKSSLAALGFLTVGKRFGNSNNDIIDDRIDAVTKTFLGLTVSCARCHDHKFDPVPTADYYSLYGIFNNSIEPGEGPLLRPPAPTPDYNDFTAKLAQLEKDGKAYRDGVENTIRTNAVAKMGDYLLAWYDFSQPPNNQTNRNIFIANMRKLDNGIYGRWDGYLRGRMNRHDPVWSPWTEFSKLNARDFAAKTKALSAKWYANKEKDKALNPLVARLFGSPPTSMKDLADRYAKLLRDVDTMWKNAVLTNQKRKLPPPTRMTDANLEQLRLAVAAPGAPPNPQGREVDGLLPQDIQRKETDFRTKMVTLKLTHPGSPGRAMVMEDRKNPQDARIFIRGNASQPGDVAPRQFLEFLSPANRQPFRIGSGRLELAENITKKDNPLTARVFMNRVWMHHFGEGIVRTPHDLGTRSDEPSHPELLDWLAATFVENGWSLKKIHRLMMLSSAYQQTSDDNPRYAQIDPPNDLLWRQNVRRLDFEALRDTMLAIGGKLDFTLGGLPVDLTREPYPVRRTIYGFVDRAALATVFRTFDFADPDLTVGQRYETTVPQQALFLMNNPLVIEQARNLVARPDFKSAKSEEERVKLLYKLIYQRDANPSEVKVAGRFLELQSSPASKLAGGPVWRYGFGEFDAANKQVKGFTPLQNFNGTYQSIPRLPHPTLKFVSVNAAGGHPGPSSRVASIRRWTAPRDGIIDIDGTLKHAGQQGDGVTGMIVSSRAGEIGRYVAAKNQAATKVVGVAVQRGDTIDFVVDCRKDDNSDGYEWAPVVKMTRSSGPMMQVGEASQWSARDDFNRPAAAQVKPLEAWEKYAQVLLLTNEMTFVN